MSFTVDDFQDLMKLLTDHPEWRAQLRPVVLGEEILAVPSRMDRVEAALDRMTERVEDLTVRLDHLTETVAQLTEDVRKLSAGMTERFNRVDGELGNIRGQILEFAFEKNLGNWLRDWVRKPRKVFTDDLTTPSPRAALVTRRLSRLPGLTPSFAQ